VIDPRDIENRFAFHAAPDQDKKDAHTSARQILHSAADLLNDLIPDGREKALVMTKLEEAMFWANAGLARQNTIERSELA
jgi:hypothetical protein